MSAARQGSYLNVVGELALIAGVASALCGRHTTSPSIPILASLDLACAHAQSHRQRLLQRSPDLAAGARQVVNDDPALSAYQRLPEPAPAGTSRHYVTADPTKLLIGTTGLRRSGEDVRLRLFHDYVAARSARRQHCTGLPRASTHAPACSSTSRHRRRGWAAAQDRGIATARSATQGDQMSKVTRWHRTRAVRATRCVPVLSPSARPAASGRTSPRPASVTTRQNDYKEIAHVQAKQVPSDCHRSARRRHCPDRSAAFAAAPAHAAARPIR